MESEHGRFGPSEDGVVGEWAKYRGPDHGDPEASWAINKGELDKKLWCTKVSYDPQPKKKSQL